MVVDQDCLILATGTSDTLYKAPMGQLVITHRLELTCTYVQCTYSVNQVAFVVELIRLGLGGIVYTINNWERECSYIKLS